jgi:hypothetical protein
MVDGFLFETTIIVLDMTIVDIILMVIAKHWTMQLTCSFMSLSKLSSKVDFGGFSEYYKALMVAITLVGSGLAEQCCSASFVPAGRKGSLRDYFWTTTIEVDETSDKA